MPAPQRTATSTKGKVSQEVSTALIGAYQGVLDEVRKDFEAQLKQQQAEWEIELSRKKEADLYDFNIAKRDREDALRIELAGRLVKVEDREVQVKAREDAVGNAEATITDLQKKIDIIPTQLLNAEATGYNKGSVDTIKIADSHARIKEAETNSVIGIKDNQIETLKNRTVELEKTVAGLREDLVTANGRVQEIANNAVAASGQSKVTVQNAPVTSGR